MKESDVMGVIEGREQSNDSDLTESMLQALEATVLRGFRGIPDSIVIDNPDRLQDLGQTIITDAC